MNSDLSTTSTFTRLLVGRCCCRVAGVSFINETNVSSSGGRRFSVPRSATVEVNQTAAFPFLCWCGFPHLYPVIARKKKEKESLLSTSQQPAKKTCPEEFSICDVISCTSVLTVFQGLVTFEIYHPPGLARRHYRCC